eukprot:4830896-Karenia_brevis.AAC.1
MVYTTTSCIDLDPYVVQFVRKFQVLRRILCKWPETKIIIQNIADAYVRLDFHGLYRSDSDLKNLEPAPPPGNPQRHLWKHFESPHGPVGLILQHSHYFASAIDFRTFTLHSAVSVPIHFTNIPVQHVVPMINRIAVHARNLYATSTRTILDPKLVPDP